MLASRPPGKGPLATFPTKGRPWDREGIVEGAWMGVGWPAYCRGVGTHCLGLREGTKDRRVTLAPITIPVLSVPL